MDPKKTLKDIESNGEHSLLEQRNTTDAVKSLEPAMEGTLMKTSEVADHAKTIAENTKPKEVQKVQLMPTDDTGELSKTLWEMLRGRPGHTPTDEELLALITPLIPAEVEKQMPEDDDLTELIKPFIPDAIPGHTPTDDELTSLITPLIPKPIKGDKGLPGLPGRDAEMPSHDELLTLIKPLIPKVKEIRSNLTGETIVAKHKELPQESRISYDDLKDTPNMDAILRKISSKDYSLTELTDVGIATPANGQTLVYNSATGKWKNGSVSGASFNPQVPVGTINGINAIFNVVLPLNALFVNGQFLIPTGVDYTLSGTAVTLLTAPPTNSTIYAI